MKADLVIMALGNASNPIIKDSEPRLATSKWGTIVLETEGSQQTTLEGIYTGGDAARGGSTAVNAAGDGQSAAREILGDLTRADRAGLGHGHQRRQVHRTKPHGDHDHQQEATQRRHRRVRGARSRDCGCGSGGPVRSRPPVGGRRAHSADARGLGREGWDHLPGDPGHGNLQHPDEQDGGGRHHRRHRRASRFAEPRREALGRFDGGVHGGWPRASAGLPDRQEAPRAGQPRHAHRGFPQREPDVLGGRGRARHRTQGQVRRPVGRGLCDERRLAWLQGLRHRAA